MKKLLVLAIASIMSLGASAQLITSNTMTYSHKKGSGYNRIGASYNSISTDAEGSGSVSGASLSWTKGISVSKSMPLYIETGIGATYAFDELNALTATIPLNVTYKLPVTEGIKIAPLAGLTFNGNILSDADDVKVFSLGWQAGVSVELGKFYVGVTYGGGLTNYAGNESYSCKLNNLAATVGIVF